MLKNKLPLLLLASPFLFASKCKDRKNKAITEDVVNVARPESTLQVTGLVPSSIPAGTTPRARVTGAGFEKQADVFVGGQQVFGVQFMSPNELRINLPALTPGMYDVKVKNNDGGSHTAYGALEVNMAEEAQAASIPSQCRDEIVINFNVNEFALEGPEQYALREYNQCFGVDGASYVVEGHCDERGTTEYNMALGERRANSVKAFLQTKGVAPSRINTRSYGEEQPAVSGSNENAWAQNRRAVIRISYP